MNTLRSTKNSERLTTLINQVPEPYSLDHWDRTLCSRIRQAIQEIAPRSTYLDDARRYALPDLSYGGRTYRLVHVAIALRDDLESGFPPDSIALGHTETHANLLSQASSLMRDGFLLAAYVCAGCCLEAHLKELCDLHGIALQDAKRQKTAGTLNSDLKGKGIYDEPERKIVEGLIGQRNRAAHIKHKDEWSEFNKADCEHFIRSVQLFIEKYVA